MGNGAVVQIVRKLLGLLGPRKYGVHHLEPSPRTPNAAMEEKVYRGTIHTWWYVLHCTHSPRLVRWHDVEIQVIMTSPRLLLQSEVNEANQHGLVVRNLYVKIPVVTGEIEIQSVEPRRGHIADCVREPYHRQFPHNGATLNQKMESYW